MEDKIKYLEEYCKANNLELQLEGSIGFGRDCVGLTRGDNYLEYDGYEMEQTPEDAYHKHDCVAVLGRGEEAINQLYDWVKNIEANYIISETLESEHSINAVIHGFRRRIPYLKKKEVTNV